jgi:hypothetical protein
MRKLLKKQGFAPTLLVTDKLRSYFKSPGSAQRFLAVHAEVYNTPINRRRVHDPR